MSEWFKLIKEEFSPVYQENQWTYSCLFPFTFKKRTIKQITITDHPWRKKGREKITKELILNLLKEKLNGRKRMKPQQRVKNRDIYVLEKTLYHEKNYLVVFWFENNNSDWLWIRNCYPIS